MAEASLVARNVTRGTLVASRVEVAGGLWAKFMGLMGRPGLAVGEALWLPDSNGIHMMFMRFPIDVAFLGAPATRVAVAATAAGAPGPGSAEIWAVLSIRRALPAWRGLVPLVRGAHGVLELPVGAIDAAAVQVGDLIALAHEPEGS